ncbi:MAG: ParB N-terminal domain-containing protein [Gemmataceae bacterium]
MEIRVLSLESLKPAPYNPRLALKVGSPRYRKLERSLREFGLVEPLVWNELSGYVVGGHARLGILRSLGIVEVPVSVVRLSPEREKALNVVLNNLEAQGRYDSDKLADLLTELSDLPELETTGFTLADLADLRLQPIGVAAEQPIDGKVEVTLATDAATFDRLSPRLDELVAAFDLTCHVRRR